MKHSFLLISAFMLCFSCGTSKKQETDPKALQAEVQTYLDGYNKEYQKLLTESAEASWALQTMIKEGDTITSKIADEKEAAMATFTGSTENIEKSQGYLAKKETLTPLQVKQLEYILYMAGSNPEVAKDIVKEKIKAGTEQMKKLYSFAYVYKKDTITANKIDEILEKSTKLDERLEVWNLSKEVGKGLKDGLQNLQSLRNKSVQALAYKDYFDYQAREYGMSGDEMMALCKQMVADVWPLYRELHTWARYELASKYKQPVPDMLPAHWMPNRWGQEWGELVQVKGLDLDKALKEKSAEWIIHQSENFYLSIGFDSLPKTFYEKSSLYPLPKNAGYSKNNHASAWHMNNDNDVRSLMSIEPNTRWWGTALHELGHIYYYQTYSNPDVPIILRTGANRAYHEAMGSLMGLAAMQKPFLQGVGLIQGEVKTNDTLLMLKEALDYIVLIPWSAGVMTEFEYDLYAKNLPKDQFNKTWWDLAKKYQGIVPASPRGEEYCDAATKTHINDDPAQYYDYAMSNILLFQFHDHIAKNILKQDPHNTNYWGNKEVGNFLKGLMHQGASGDWKELLKKNVGSDVTAKPMLDYFQPLMVYLKKVNEGRTYSLPEKI